LHWLKEPNVDLQQGAFQLLSRAIEKHTEMLVVNVATDEDPADIVFPSALIEIVQEASSGNKERSNGVRYFVLCCILTEKFLVPPPSALILGGAL
jgi:hypothetical protein